MKKRGKALLATLLCAAMTLTMAACGKKMEYKSQADANGASYSPSVTEKSFRKSRATGFTTQKSTSL